MRTWVLTLVVPFIGGLFSSTASAQDSVASCNAAYVDAQLAEKGGKYLEAAQKAQACSKPVCGEVLSGECAKFLDVIVAATPSVVFGARDGNDNDLVNVTVTVDGKVVQEKLNGTPVALNAGAHVIRFEVKGLPPVEKSYAIRAGEKLRLLSETLGEKKHLEPLAPLPLPPSSGPSPKSYRVAAIVAGILGAGGFATFGGLYSVGMNDYNALKAKCAPAPNCSQNFVDSDSSHAMFSGSYVGLGVGIAGLAAAGTLTILSLGKHDRTVVGILPATQGTGAAVVATF